MAGSPTVFRGWREMRKKPNELRRVLRRMRTIGWSSITSPTRPTYMDHEGRTHHPADSLMRGKRKGREEPEVKEEPPYA